MISTLKLAVISSAKKVFKECLKEAVEHMNFNSVGRRFQALDVATENALSPNLILVLGMTGSPARTALQ